MMPTRGSCAPAVVVMRIAAAAIIARAPDRTDWSGVLRGCSICGWRNEPPRWGVAPLAGTLIMTASTSRVIGVALLVLVQGCILAVDRGGRPPELGRQRVPSNSVARRATQGYS